MVIASWLCATTTQYYSTRLSLYATVARHYKGTKAYTMRSYAPTLPPPGLSVASLPARSRARATREAQRTQVAVLGRPTLAQGRGPLRQRSGDVRIPATGAPAGLADGGSGCAETGPLASDVFVPMV